MTPDEKTDEELVTMALHMWANWVETNNPMMSANDVAAMRNPLVRIKALTDDSKQLVARLRDLADKER